MIFSRLTRVEFVPGRLGKSSRGSKIRSRGFTVVELVASMSILAVILVMVAQTSVWSFRERMRSGARHLAQELACNVLERARGLPWQEMNQEWANRQKLPPEYELLLPGGKLAVRIEADAKLSGSRRVSVEIHWKIEPAIPESVRLEGLFSPRARAGKGGKS